MKSLLYTLALLTTLAPAMAQDAPNAPVAAPYMPTVHLDSGIVITPVLRPASDLETIMDVHFWQFHVQTPAPDTFVMARLELRMPGKEPQQIGIEGSNFFPEKLNLVVGIAPVIGNSLTTADNWKTYYRRSALSGEPSANNGSLSSGNSNPVKDLHFQLSRYGNGDDYALPQTNGDIPLASFYSTPTDMNRDNKETLVAELILVLTAKTTQKPK